MAVGLPLKVTYADGDVYSASDVNDTNGTINLFQTSTLSRQAGKNAVINGGMDIWQRGTSIAGLATYQYTADRWFINANSAFTISRQATGDTTNLPNIQYALRFQRNNASTNTSTYTLTQSFETVNSIPLAGKTVTLSFYARKGANYSPASSNLITYLISGTGTDQNYANTGYTGSAFPINNQTATLTTTWQRFTYTGTLAATATEIAVYFEYTGVGTAGAADYFEITGVQLELGSYATTFSRAGGSIGGELALCQRYYERVTAGSLYERWGYGVATSTTNSRTSVFFKVPKRTGVTSIDYSANIISGQVVTSGTLDQGGIGSTTINWATTGVTNGQFNELYPNGSSSSYIGFNAEL